MVRQGLPPEWLLGPARAVLDDLQRARPIEGLTIIATVMDEGFNGLHLGLVEGSRVRTPLEQLPDELDPHTAQEYGGGNWVPRSMTGPELLTRIAEQLQEDLAESSAGWGEARPPCPHHPHPAVPAVRDAEAWWICTRSQELLYRIGRGEVPARLALPDPWRPRESRRARKRRHHRPR